MTISVGNWGMARVDVTELGHMGNGGLRADVTIGEFTFTGRTGAWPGSETYRQFERLIAALRAFEPNLEEPNAEQRK